MFITVEKAMKLIVDPMRNFVQEVYNYWVDEIINN